MVNEDYEPTRHERWVLDTLREGRANPKLIKDNTGLNDQQVNYSLHQLIAAGWVEKPVTGLYELTYSPDNDD